MTNPPISTHLPTRHRWELRYTQTIFEYFNISRNEGYNCRCLKENTLGINKIEKGSFQLYPNPAQNELNIKITDDQQGKTYTILDNLGRQVSSGVLNGPENKLVITDLKPGVYLFIYENSSKHFIKN